MAMRNDINYGTFLRGRTNKLASDHPFATPITERRVAVMQIMEAGIRTISGIWIGEMPSPDGSASHPAVSAMATNAIPRLRFMYVILRNTDSCLFSDSGSRARRRSTSCSRSSPVNRTSSQDVCTLRAPWSKDIESQKTANLSPRIPASRGSGLAEPKVWPGGRIRISQ